jgi:gluconokinase
VTTQPLALGIDLGTGSVRAFLFDAAGRRLGGVRHPYSWRTSVDGSVEADADAVVSLVFTAMDEAVATLQPGGTVAAVGFSALWHTLLGIADDGAPVTPVYAWSDTRAISGAAALRAQLNERAVHARTGARLHPSYPPAKLHWLRATDPAQFRRAMRWLSLPEYLWLQLTGEHVADVSIAAGSGLLDQQTLAWDDTLLDACGIERAQLGRVAGANGDAALSGRDVRRAARWPALQDAHWRLPVGDGACANVGSGCSGDSMLALSLGTSGALRVLLSAGYSPPPAGLFAYRLDRDRLLLGGAISNGGVVRSWLHSLLQLPHDASELDALLAARQPAAHGLDMLPFLAGERSPAWPLDATASITGLRLATSALDILQAGMEGVAYRLAILRRQIADAVPQAATIVASGGALRESPYWAQLLADVLGEPLLLTADAETSSRGAALLALESAGATASAAAMPPTVTVQPDASRHAIHHAAIQRQLERESLLGDGLAGAAAAADIR